MIVPMRMPDESESDPVAFVRWTAGFGVLFCGAGAGVEVVGSWEVAFVYVADGSGVLLCETDTSAGVGVEVMGSWAVVVVGAGVVVGSGVVVVFVMQMEPSKNVSAGHLQASKETAPGLVVALCGQGVQVAFPMVSLYVFAAHASHVPWNPVVPSGQGFG